MKINFEAAIEKLARIMSRNYNVNIVFKQGTPSTDGKTINLPFLTNMTQELYNDLNGFLDHEVAHCKFTDFNEFSKICKIPNLKFFVNAIEDERIEEEMKLEYPGVSLHLDPLNYKYNNLMKKESNWKKLPPSVRFIVAIRDIMGRREPIIDSDIDYLIFRCWHKAENLSNCTSTKEVIEKVKEIMEIASLDMTEDSVLKLEKKESKDLVGTGSSDLNSEITNLESRLPKKTSAKDKVGKGMEFKEKDLEKIPDIHKFIEEKISKFEDNSKTYSEKIDHVEGYMWESQISKPSTTAFDKVTDYSSKGSDSEYIVLRNKVQKHIVPMKLSLEKILKVKENAKWKIEQERGKLNANSLSKLITNPGYRTVFKTFSKHDTKNVAIEMLIDLSGSMAGGEKIMLAKECATVLAESLTDLNINFEITGFNSRYDENVHKVSHHSFSSDPNKYSRPTERLDLYVFKSFETSKLNGITKIKAFEQNPDGECVAWAAKRLISRKEKRKILFVLSDGIPATGDTAQGILNNDLKVKVKQIEASGIECVGIGIASDGVSNFYKNYVIVNNLHTLTEVFTKKVKEILLK